MTYGRYDTSFLPTRRDDDVAVARLFASQPQRPLGFHYGYPDPANHAHLIVTRKPEGTP